MATLLLGTTIGGYAAIHAGNIGAQSVNYASSAGSVTWSNITSRPTLLSQFTNDLGNYGSWITASYLDDYTRGDYRVISDYGGHTTWYMRSGGQFIWGRSHDWSYAFRLNLPSGSQNNGTWAYIGQQDSNAASGTWRGLRVRKYDGGSIDGDLSAGAFYIGDTRKDLNWDTAYGWGNHASAGYATQTYVNTAVANLVASAPSTLDTLNELAAALGNDAAFSTTVTTALGNRLRIDTGSQGLNSTQQGYGRTNLGLGTVATYAVGDFASASHNHSGVYLPLGGSWSADLASYGFTRQAGYTATGGEWVILTNNAQVSTLIDGSYFAGENGGFYSMASNNTYASRKGFYNDGTYANFNTSVYVTGDIVNQNAIYPGYNNSTANAQTSYYLYGNTGNSGIRTNGNFLANGDIYLGTRGNWLSTYLNQNVRTDSSPTFSSVYFGGSQLTTSMVNGLSNMLGVTTLPYSCDITVNGDPDKFYAVQFWGGDQDVWRRIIIKRGYSEPAPWDPIGTGVHHGGLLLDWEGNFGGWGGAEYADRIRVFNESYTNVCADMFIYSHSMGYVFMLRGGGAVYHLFSDQAINGFYQSGSPDILYSSSTLSYDDAWSGTNQYDVYAPTPLGLAQVNSSRIDGLRTKKQSLLDGRYLRQGVDISGISNITTSNNISSLNFLASNAYYLNGTSYYLNSTNGGIYTNARFESASTIYASGGNSSQWNTAYGWGNHASAGYLTSIPSHNHDDRYYTETEINNFSYWRNDEDRRVKVLRFTGEGGDSGVTTQPYAIYQAGGAWTHPYPDLRIAFHTGIQIGANTSYGGTRFYNEYDMVTELMSIGNTDNNVRVAYNLYMGGNIVATQTWVNSALSNYIPINPDGDGPSWQYSDANPTINGTYVGGRQSFGADGDALTGGALQARLLNAYDGHVNSAYGYYVGNLNYGGDSGTHSTTQVIDSSGRWVGLSITDSYISSASNWNTAYNWGNHASGGYLKYRGINAETDFQRFQDNAGEVRFDQINDYNNLSNAPGGYNYGGVLSMRGENFGFQIWGSHTGDLYFKTQWNGDQYSGWRSIVHSANIGSQSVNYASSAGSVAWTNVSGRPTALSQFSNDLGNYGGWVTSSALNSYLALSGGTLTGALTINSTAQAFTNVTLRNTTSASSMPSHLYFYIEARYNSGSNGTNVYHWVRDSWEYNITNNYSDITLGATSSGSSYVKLFTVSTNGHVYATNSFRAPIFYDSADAAYYVDPNDISQLHITRTALRAHKNMSGYGVGNWQSDFSNTPVSSMTFGQDKYDGGPSGTWWFQVNMRHNNGDNLWGTQLAYGWEDNANEIYQRNVTGGSWSGWVRYINSNNYAGILDARYYTESEVNSLLSAKQNSSTAITTSNIGSQSVNYAASAGSASNLQGYSAYDLVTESRGMHSGSDFPNGTLVRTEIDANGWAGDSFIMEVSGKSYGSGTPFKLVMEGYLYADTIINVSAMSYGSYFPGGLVVFRLDGKLCFWWARGSYWNSFEVHVRTANGDSWNRVTAISDSPDPGGDKRVGCTPTQVVHSGNIGSQSVNYATTAGSTNAVGGLSVHGGRNNEVNKIVRTDANGYLQTGWINTPSGAFGSAITKIYCSDDDYIRYQTPANFISNLGLITTSSIGSQSVNYASSAGSVAWGNVSGRPTAVSSFSNDSGYLTSGGTINSAYRAVIEDTRSGQRSPNDYDDYRVSWEFTNQITSGWHSVMTLQGWHNGYSAWQIIGPADGSSHENWYLRSGNVTTWNSLRTIIHSGNIGSQSVNYASSAGSATTASSLSSMNISQFTNNSGYVTASANVASADRLYPLGAAYGDTHPGYGLRAWYDWNYSGTYRNGITIGSNPGDQAYGWQLWQNMWDDRLYMRRYNSGWQGQRILLDNGSNPYAYDMNQYVRTSDNVTFSTINATTANLGAVYANNWFRAQGDCGLYQQDYGGHFRRNTNSSYGTWEIFGYAKGGYNGLLIKDDAGYYNNYMHEGGNGGLYLENQSGRWAFYWHRSNASMGIGDSTTSSSYKLYVSGSIYSTGDIVAYSDRRKKTDIVTIESALDKVKEMRGVFYTKIDEVEKGRQVGVIAQEMNEVLPEAVTYAADVDEYGVKYGNIVGVLIEAIKEQQKEIEELKAKLN